VAIAGMGGIGGIDLVTLARLGIGRFTIADPDVFDVANTNRQYGAMSSTMGRQKVDVMSEIARGINPEMDLRVFSDPIGPDNAERFLGDADLFIDAIDAFEMDARRLLFHAAASQGIYAITAGPVGFGGIWITFDPNGMSFDRYFDLSDGMDSVEQLVAFVLGIAPKGVQWSYVDPGVLNVQAQTSPSSSVGCHIAAGAVGCEAVKILLGKGGVRTAPSYQQFDPFANRFVRRRLRAGNRHPIQRIKRWWVTRYLRRKARDTTTHNGG
jgi:molybdopterin/thiamine biosynthesis adenylyltransferase